MPITHATLMLSIPGGGEMLLLGVVILLLFGAKKIPELAKGIGKGIKDFNEAKDNKEKQEEA